jgi:hyperosmotically inducible protein
MGFNPTLVWPVIPHFSERECVRNFQLIRGRYSPHIHLHRVSVGFGFQLMKNRSLFLFLTLLVSPMALIASSVIDRQIEYAAKASYNYRTVLENKVNVRADHGVVTLFGTVPDGQDCELAVATVEDLPGVASVKNEITIKSPYPEHSDSWIALKVRSRLLVEANVSASTTHVSAQSGVITLTGTAVNGAQKELTGAYAKDIAFVKSIKNDIVVVNAAERESSSAVLDDASITALVKLALLRHTSPNSHTTTVTTHDGIIVVTGEASSDAERSLVTKLAQGVRAVKSVSNHMTVKS